jgi:hypothetical protein
MCGLDSSSSGLDPVAGSCEHRNEHSVPYNVGNFLISSVTISFSGRIMFRGVSFKKLKYPLNETYLELLIVSWLSASFLSLHRKDSR